MICRKQLRQLDPCYYFQNAAIYLLTVITFLLLPSIQHVAAESPAPSPPIRSVSNTPLKAVIVFAGPSSQAHTVCPRADRISASFYVTMHYNATIDATSIRGTKGLVVDSTVESIMVHMGDVGSDPMLGWIKGLFGLCQGDFITLIVPPDLAYGDEGDGENIPGGATLKLDVEIVTAHPDPQIHAAKNDIQNAETMFAEMDSNGDGKVTLDEMELYLDVPEDYPERETFILQHFQLSDYNRDGTVSFEEFKTILDNFQGADDEL